MALASVHSVGTAVKATSNSDGRYTLSNIPPGIVTLRVGRVAYTPIVKPDIRVTSGAPAIADFRMSQQSLIPGLRVTSGMINPASGGREPWRAQSKEEPLLDSKTAKNWLADFERAYWNVLTLRASPPHPLNVKLNTRTLKAG